MMKTAGTVGLLALFCAGTAFVLPACGQEAGAPEGPGRAEAVLRRLATCYRDAQSYRGRFTLATRITTTQAEQELEIVLELAWQRPNKLSAQVQAGVMPLEVRCDGQAYFVYVEVTNKFLERPAPESLADVFELEPLNSLLAGGLGPMVVGLFGQDPYAALTEGVERMEPVGAEQVAGTPAEHVRLHAARTRMDLWVDEAGRLLQARLDPWQAIARAKAANPELQEVTIELVHEPGTTDEAFPAETFAFRPPEDAERADDFQDLMAVELAGKLAPDFTLEGLAEGTVWRLSEHRGKVVLLDFWATWCGPCRAELPELQKVYEGLADEAFLMLAVNVGDQRAAAASFVEQEGLTMPVALDSDGLVAARYGASAIPHTVIIGRDGVVAEVHSGYRPGVGQAIRREIDALLKAE